MAIIGGIPHFQTNPYWSRLFYTILHLQKSLAVLHQRFGHVSVFHHKGQFPELIILHLVEAQSQSLRIFLGRRLRIAWWFTVCHHGFTCLEHPLKTSIISIPNYQRLQIGPGLFTNTVQEVVFWNWKLNRKPTIGTLTPPTTALWENHDKSSRDQPAIGVYLRIYQGWLKKNSNVQCYSAKKTPAANAQLPWLPWSLGVPSTLKTAPTTSTTPGGAIRGCEEVFEPPGRGGSLRSNRHQFRWNLWNSKENWSNIGTLRLPTAKGFYITLGVLIRWDWMFGWKIKPLGLWHAQGGYAFW